MKSCNRSDRSNSKISVFINKQTYKRLKERTMWERRQKETCDLFILTELPPRCPSRSSVFSLRLFLSHYLSSCLFVIPTKQPGGPISCLVNDSSNRNLLPHSSVIGGWLPWRRHRLWVLEVWHHNGWDGEPADGKEETSSLCCSS